MTLSTRASAVALASLALACSSSPVTPPGDQTVATVTAAPTSLAFDALGLTTQIETQVRNSEGQLMGVNVSWRVESGDAVTVSASGLVTAVKNGTATVRATAGGVTADIPVVVQQVPDELRITNSPGTLTVLGEIVQMRAEVTDRNGRAITGIPITWSTSNALVAPISTLGAVTAARVGTSTITATAGARSVSTPVSVNLNGPLGGALVGAEIPCSGGMAGPFPCNNVKLMSYLPVSGLGGGSGVELNDLWGWVDPQTNREYAIVMRNDGTAFVDVTDPLNPAYLGFLPIPDGATPNTWHDVKVYANHAFIVADAAGQHGIQVFDLTTLRGVQFPPPVQRGHPLHQRGICAQHLHQRGDRVRLFRGRFGGWHHLWRWTAHGQHPEPRQPHLRRVLRRCAHRPLRYGLHPRCAVRDLQRPRRHIYRQGDLLRQQRNGDQHQRRHAQECPEGHLACGLSGRGVHAPGLAHPGPEVFPRQ